MKVRFRDCVSGEIFNNINDGNYITCSSCTEGMYSLVTPILNSDN